VQLSDAKFWVEIIAALAIPGAVGFVVWHRIKTEMGMGVRAIQFLGLAIVPPLIIILALEGILERSAVGALVYRL
jgi:hypothetical protein